VFANPRTGKPYHQEEIQKKHIRKVASQPASEAISDGTRSVTAIDRGWMKLEPFTAQKELMRHASILTTMNIYGKAMTNSKRQAHSKVV